MQISVKTNEDYESCNDCIHSDDSVEICKLRECVHAVEVKECYEPKTGHWILIDKESSRYKCSECGEVIRLYKKSEISKLEKDETLSDYPFSHCGAKMIEPQESEDKE